MVPVVAGLLRDQPEGLGVTSFGAPENWKQPARPARNPARAAMVSLRDAIRSRTFWALTPGFSTCGATTNGLVGMHFIPSAHGQGMPQTTTAGLLALVGIFDIAGTSSSGWPCCLYCSIRQQIHRCSFSSSSTDLIGSPSPLPRRPCVWKRLENEGRWFSVGCSIRTRSVPRSRLSPRASSAITPASTHSPGSARLVFALSPPSSPSPSAAPAPQSRSCRHEHTCSGCHRRAILGWDGATKINWCARIRLSR